MCRRLNGDYNYDDFLLEGGDGGLSNVLTTAQLTALNDNLTNNSVYHTDLTLRFEQTYADYLSYQIAEAEEEEATNWGYYILACFEMMALNQQSPGFSIASINAYNSHANGIHEKQQDALDNIDYAQQRSAALNVALVDTKSQVDDLTLKLVHLFLDQLII